MSGGSYNYLCDSWDTAEALANIRLADMATRLEARAPGHPVTLETRRLADLAASPLPQSALDVWRAVEWVDSCDWSDEDLQEELDATEGWRR